MTISSQGLIRDWNQGAQNLLGWTRSEISGKPFSLLGLSSTSSQETFAVAKNGGSIDVKVSSTSPATEGGDTLLFATDIREKKFLELALFEATEREQRRIGQELHDHLCQHLLGAAFAAKALAGALDKEGSTHAASLHELARLINDSVTQARDIARGLHPVELDSEGLMFALQELANRTKHSIECDFTCKHPVLVHDSNTSRNAFRIAQETVSYAIQSGARHVSISLHPHGDSIYLEIMDDSPTESELISDPLGTPARTLQYRAQSMNGKLTFSHTPGQGTQTICTFPANS